MVSTCKYCGNKVNGHCNIHATCPKCGKPYSIISEIRIVGTLNEEYSGELRMVPLSRDRQNMYYYDDFAPELNCFVSKTNELYKIDSWFGHTALKLDINI